MIISHKHKFIFFKTIKTAGTSIQSALAEHCGERDVITGEGKKNTHKLPKIPALHHEHVYLTFVKQWLEPEIWDSYFKFAFIRNPFDLAVSKYYWDFKNRPDKLEYNYETIKNMNFPDLDAFHVDEGTPMVHDQLWEKHEYYPEAGNQYQSLNYEHTFYPWLCDNIFYKDEKGLFKINPNLNPYNNGIDIDFVGRYEQLDKDINYIGEILGLKLKLPKMNTDTRDKTRKIHEYYDDETMFYIEDYFKYDLDRFFQHYK